MKKEFGDINKKSFSVPDGYFQELEENVMARIGEETKRRPLTQILKPAASFAAAFALLFSLGYGFLYITKTLQEKQESISLQVAQTPEQSSPTEEISSDYADAVEEYLIYCGVSAATLTAEAME